SILDSLTEEVKSLARVPGPGDTGKLSEYLDSVREIEQRIQNTERQGALSVDLPDRPIGIPDSFDEHTKLMLDLVALAFRTDITRAFTMIFSRELSTRTFANIGEPEQHQPNSHHRNDPELIAKKARIDTYHVQLLSYFLTTLQAAREGDRTLLDQRA